MAFLRFLGWVFVPYIMIFFRWKRLRGAGKTFGIIWGLFALIIAISSASSSKSPQQSAAPVTSSPDAATPPAQQTTAPVTAPAPQAFKVGDQVKNGNLTFTVNSVKTASQIGDQFLNKKADGTFLIVNVTVKNGDTQSRVVDTNMFKLVSGSKSYDPDATADMYINPGDAGFFLKQVNPDVSATGNLVFDIPTDLKGEKLQVEDGFGWAGGKFQTIDLGQ